jgi:hypothetical protein
MLAQPLRLGTELRSAGEAHAVSCPSAHDTCRAGSSLPTDAARSWNGMASNPAVVCAAESSKPSSPYGLLSPRLDRVNVKNSRSKIEKILPQSAGAR